MYNLKLIFKILKLSLVLIVIICIISGSFLLCRFYSGYRGQEWILLIFALGIFSIFFETIFEINEETMLKIGFSVLGIIMLLSVFAVSYFKNDTIHSILNKNDGAELSATIWYFSKYEQGDIYKFSIFDNGKVCYQYSLMPFDLDKFDTNIMDKAKAKTSRQLKMSDGMVYVTRSKYDKLIGSLDKIKARGNDADNYDQRYMCYAYYDGSVINMSSPANVLKKEILTDIFNSINFYDPYPLTSYDELSSYVKNKWKNIFTDILQVSIYLFVAILFILGILKTCIKIKANCNFFKGKRG